MNVEQIRELINDLQLNDVIEASRTTYFAEAMQDLLEQRSIFDLHNEDQSSLATAIERLALDVDGSEDDGATLFDKAFLCRRTTDLSDANTHGKVFHYFYLSIDALLAGRRAELRMLLQESQSSYNFDTSNLPRDWPHELLLRIARSFILLCRKEGGWADVHAAVSEIEALRHLQRGHQEAMRRRAQEDRTAAGQLISLFNLAKIVDIAARYTINGAPSDALLQIDRHASNVTEILELQPEPELLHFADMLSAGARQLIKSSVWFNTRTLGTRIREFVDHLTGEDRHSPLLELWPSQRTALGSSLLDPAKRAIVVEMPTSAGKTLIAEFSIVQALALNPDSRIAYVVPTRALINQIVIRLRSDIGSLGYRVEAAVPVFELDPTEDILLRRNVDILVVTPEKLDLLIRSDHPVVRKLSLIVVDEAHNIADGARGARLELLLGTLKRERADARFLLLTPFVPNGDTLAAWLGDSTEGTIRVSWRPSERITAASFWRKPRNRQPRLILKTLPSSSNVDLNEELEVDLGPVRLPHKKTKGSVSVSTVLRLARRGGVLVLARSRSVAETRATEIAAHMENHPLSDFGDAVVRYIQSELGNEHELARLIKKGVAYHHAGLSHDLRYLIELLIDREDVQVVCGTTTLAQGVNFPIGSVIVETLFKYQGRRNGMTPMSYSEFWNIAGRAGRALRDRLGLVLFPAVNNNDIETARNFLRGEAAQLASVLLNAIRSVSLATSELDIGFVRQNEELGAFLQYLTHAIRVAGLDFSAAELEDVLRSSLVYHQAREVDSSAAERLVRLTRRYVEQLQGRQPGYLSLADGTGFSLYSVDLLYAKQREEHPEFRSPDFWTASNLFASDPSSLTSAISMLGEVPELTLGEGSAGVFDASRIAGIVRDWVAGGTVIDIADKWFRHISDATHRRRRAGHYLYSRLISQIPWGLGVLQRLSLGGNHTVSDFSHIPSLVFYGVPTREAVSLRMVGVPRAAAQGMTETLQGVPTSASYEQLRDWVAGRNVSDWDNALEPESVLTGADCKAIWSSLSGVAV
ncbi:DEAD/DEAH box helicase [Nonomuraea wenchangensis]|uniref:DEAD/DEAH box helicase n=1 Tax=Nonomuraea wenchangensis TaxID=568860 RepID=UPI0033F70DAC